jgi:hypothetical protein
LKREDSEAMNRIAEDASAKDRTGWFKRARWDEHLQAYPDWKLLAYAIRLPGDDEPALEQVVLVVRELVKQAVRGLSTLSIETLRWLRSAKPSEADARPLGRMQNKSSQQRAARLWARLLCYCVRLVAAEEADEAEEEEQQHQQHRRQKPVNDMSPDTASTKPCVPSLPSSCPTSHLQTSPNLSLSASRCSRPLAGRHSLGRPAGIMAPLASPEMQPENDTTSTATAGNSSRDAVATSLLPKGYEKLTTNGRSILAKVNDR